MIGPGVPQWWFLRDWNKDEILEGEEDQQLISYNRRWEYILVHR